jgi:hypothetical protein
VGRPRRALRDETYRYSAPGARPVTVSETATAPRLEPTDLTTVRVP